MITGKTPIVRAKELERRLGIKEIYIKLEGMNPGGHKISRVAEILMKDAQVHEHKIILVDGSESYIRSVLYFADLAGIHCKIALFKNEKWKKSRFKARTFEDFRQAKFDRKIEVFDYYATEEDAYLAIEGYFNRHLSLMALENLVEEIGRKTDYALNSIYTQLGYGYTFTSIYNILLKQWIKGKIEQFPNITCGTWDESNRLFEHYLEKRKFSPSLFDKMDTPEDRGFVADKRLLQETLDAIQETNGRIKEVTKEELKTARTLLKKTEQIMITDSEAYPLAAFLQDVHEGQVKEGKHIIILNDARSVVSIEDINTYDELSKIELIDLTRKWLAQYSDSKIETEDAIANAREKGFILLAKRDDDYEGICIIVHMGFENFIPTYHLAYIGVDNSTKGRGVASELIKRAIELTDGKISLHVDLDNKGAKKLYEKYGFEHTYNRMIYKGQ